MKCLTNSSLAISDAALLIFSFLRAEIFFIGSFFSVAALAPILWMNMHQYQKQRVLTFFNPESDPLGSGYHLMQSKIALGSGGLTGKGFLEGSILPSVFT